MIKFFRKIRQSLITQNKVSKYLLYAIGEIILVVIGILLALNINNRNEHRINEAKFINILKEIQDDLSRDIQRATIIFDRFIVQDSIQNLILNNKYTEEAYKTGRHQILGNYYLDFVIQTDGYENLILNIDNVPEKYQPLLKDLKFLYGRLATGIDVYNTRIRETVYKNIDYIYSLEWYQKSIKGIKTEEEMNYYLNSTRYKGEVIKYVNDLTNVSDRSQRYKEKAIEIYQKISELINSDELLPEFITKTSIDTPIIDEIVGAYVLKGRVGNFGADKANFINEDNELYFEYFGTKVKLVWHKDLIFKMGSSTIYLDFDKSNKGELFVSNNIKGNATYMKVED